jgi:Kef-type K+ transport system membrane component KefB
MLFTGCISTFTSACTLDVCYYPTALHIPVNRMPYLSSLYLTTITVTAFPVLCRILTELKLLDTNVGIIVLSAGVGNDIVGWTLLALSVALVNAGTGLTAVYILLACVGYALFLLLLGKPILLWLAHQTGSIDNGPTMLFMTITILVMFGSAFFTDVIGVHAIFGSYFRYSGQFSHDEFINIRRIHDWYYCSPRGRTHDRAHRKIGRHGCDYLPPSCEHCIGVYPRLTI